MTTPTTVQVRLKLRRDTAANWTAANPTLLAGECGLESDTNRIKIGNGSTAWNSLGYFPFVVSGGTVTGNLEIGTTGTLTFEGSVADGFETTLGVINPTADRTINLPNVSGTIITTGDSGTVTSAMIADGTIVDADISATAEIAVSKLADGAARQLLQTDAAGTGVEWTDNVDIPGTLDVTGAATFDGAVTVTGDLTVNGTTTNINTQNLVVEDKNIILGDVATPTDVTADGGGITLKGATDKTINWVDATDAWTSSERFSVPLGSAASPSLTFTGDENTGIYSPGADQVAISTNGTGRLFVNSDGTVSVGNASTPAGVTSLGLRVSSDTGAGQLLVLNKSNDATNPANITLNKSRGTAASPSVVLAGDIAGSIFANAYDGSTHLTIAGVQYSVDSVSGANDLSGFLTFHTRPSGVGASQQERLRITSAGLVGIGTSAPAFSLDVTGAGAQTIRVNTTDTSGTNTGRFVALYTGGGGGTQSQVDLLSGNGFSRIGTSTNTPLTFTTNGLERCRIDSSGRLLVGTSSARATRLATTAITPAVQTLDQGSGGFFVYNNVANPNPATIFAAKSRGNDYTSAVQNGDSLFRISAAGADGTQATEAVRITAEVDGAPGTDDMPGRLVFSTTADGASSPTERMRIDNAGKVGIGTTSPTELLSLSQDVTTEANLLSLTGTSLADGEKIFATFKRGAVNLARVGAEVGGAGTTGQLIFETAISSTSTERARIDSSGRLLVGTSTSYNAPSITGTQYASLNQIHSAVAGVGSQLIAEWSTSTATGGSSLKLAKSNSGTIGSHTALSTNMDIGSIVFAASDGTSFINAASILSEVDGTPGANDMPGRLVFSTTSDGASSPTERLRITSAGVLQVADAGNIAVGTTTGTKIGTATTQKLGFYNATPVVQPAAVADATDAATVITQLNDLLAKLRTLGIIAT